MIRRRVAPRVRSLIRAFAWGTCVLGTIYACTDSGDLSAPGRNGRAAQLSFAPSFSYLGGSSYFGEPINRIRLTARNQATNEIVGRFEQDVDPNAQSWDIGLDVTLRETISVIVTVELINVTNGAEAVQWSGLTAPISVSPASSTQPTAPVALFQGPPSNLGVSAVVISPDSATIEEGTSTTFGASITGPSGSVAAWSVTDAAIASVSQAGVVTGLRNGVTSVIAVAGPRSDTVQVRVTQAVGSVAIAPDSLRVASIGGEATFTARVLDPRGAEIVGSGVAWSVADAAIAEHVGNGRFVGKANGTTTVTATSLRRASASATARLTVSQQPARVDVTPANATLTAVGGTQAFAAAVQDGAGAPMSVPVTWRSSNTAVATITAAGVATAVGAGTTEISAVAGSGADTAVGRASLQVTQEPSAIEITPNATTLTALGDAFVFTGVAKDANGNALQNARLTWTSAHPSVATVEDDGRVTAVGNGTATISARLGNVSAAASVLVQQAAAALALATLNDTVAVNDTVRFRANVSDANANPMAAAAVAWTSSNTDIATIDATGLATGRRAGTVTITATHGSLTATGTLVVLGAPNLVVSVVTTPDTEWTQGDTVGAVLTVRNVGSADAGPSKVRLMLIEADGRQWSDDATPGPEDELVVDIPAIRALDEFVVRIPGLDLDTLDNWPETLRIRALADTLNAVAESNESDNEFISNTKTIRHKVQSVVVTPADATITSVPGTRQMSAVVNGFAGRVLSRAVTWTSTAPGVATVSDSGLVTSVSNGQALIIATSEGRADTATITVNQAVGSIAIVSDTIWFRTIGRTASLTAEVRDGANQVVPNAPVTWRSLNDSIAAVDAQGVVTALRNGVTQIEAAADGKTAVLQVRVQQVAHSIAVTPDPATVVSGSTVQLTATAADSAAHGIANAAFTWRTVDSTIATVNGSGLVTGVRTGTTSVTATLGALGGSATVNVTAGSPATVTAIGDTLHEAVVARFLDDSLGVRVVDANNNPVPNVQVTWTPDSIGGEVVTSRPAVMADGIGARIMAAPPASVTNEDGIAKALWKLGHRAKPQTLQACVATQCVTFRALGKPDRPNKGNKNTLADGQEVVVARIAPNAVEVIVTDTFDNPVPGAVVQWALSANHGSLNSTSTTTDSAGRAVVSWTMPQQRGSYRLDYSVRDALGALVDTGSFRAIAKPDKAKNHARSNDEQVVTVNQIAPNALQLAVSDSFGNPIDGALVVWSLRDEHNGASLSAESVTTDTAGVATVSWTNVGKVAGVMFVDYTIFHDGEELSGFFRAHARAGKAKKANKKEGVEDQIVVVNQIAPDAAELTVLDEFDNPTRGTVIWSVGNNHGTLLTDDTVAIDTLTGKATVQWRLPTAKGRFTLDYTVIDEDGQEVESGDFKIQTRADKPRNHARNNDDQTVTVNQTAPNALELTLTDQFGNAVEGATVNWALRAGHVEGALNATSSVTDTAGKATVGWTNVGKKAGVMFVDYSVTHDDTTVTGSFRANARAARAAKGQKHAGDEQQVTVARVAPNALEVKVLDEFDNPAQGSVDWEIVGNLGLLSASTSPVDTTTGIATVRWEMPTTKGRYAVVFTVKDTAGAVIVVDTFKATAKPDKPGRSAKAAGTDDQTVVVFTPLANALQVVVSDTFGNPVGGAVVHWSLREPKSLDAQLSAASDTTNEDGEAGVSWLMGKKSGAFFVDYAVKDSAGNTLVSGAFRATGNPGPRVAVKAFRGAGADTTSSDALNDTIQLSAKTFDAFGNERTGDSISWSKHPSETKLEILDGGRIETRGNGVGSITVTSGAVSGNFFVLVDQKVKSVSIGRNSEGAVDTLTALQFNKLMSHTVKDRKNNPIDFSRYLSQITWESLDPGIVTVTKLADSVIVRSISDGVARVVATADHDTTITDTVFVAVKQSVNAAAPIITITGFPCAPNPNNLQSVLCPAAPGSVIGDSTVKLIAHALDQRGNPVRRFKWTVSDASAGTIIGSSTDSIVSIKGLLVGSPFTVTVTDQRNSAAQTHTITVIAAPPTRPVTPVGEMNSVLGDPKASNTRAGAPPRMPNASPPRIDLR